MDWFKLVENYQLLNENIYVKRLIIIVVYAIFAKGADLFIDRVLKRLAGRTKILFDDHLVCFLHTPICWTIFWMGVLHALVIEEMNPPWQTVLPAATKSFVLLIWSVAVLRVFNKLAEDNFALVLNKGQIGRDLFHLLKNIFRVIIVIVSLLWILAIWDVDLTPLFASAGIAGIAVALAAKDTLANFFGGISIFMDGTFKVGEYIILDSGERGEVVLIGIRSTRIKTRDDVIVTIPNSILANSKIINESAPIPRFRIRVPVGVAYGSDLGKVERVLLDVAARNPNVVKEPEPRVRVRNLADSSVNFELLCWVGDPRLKGLEIHNLLAAVHDTFAEQGITIPFPQRDIHLINQ
jgi:small-conductance mechanosensitive channel